MQNEKTLDSLIPGESGVIISVGNRDGKVKRRLVDMGLTPGTFVRVKKIAPFGDPIEITIRGYELSLRSEDARQIIIAEAGHDRKKRAKKTATAGYGRRRLDPETQRRMLLAHEHELDIHSGYDATAHDRREMKLALAGNPNSGKTTLFNALTGSDQYVGNWPGVTVEKKEGKAKLRGKSVTIVDLPGIYSLSPYSQEEIVARNFIIGEAPDAIINIVDASNLERNLYLTVQLLELERPMVVALNFMDEVEKSGDSIDAGDLSHLLGIPVVPITAKTGRNLDELLYVAHRQMHVGFTVEPDDLYDDFTHEIHHRVGELIHDRAYEAGVPAHWAAIKLLEGDSLLEDSLGLDASCAVKLRGIIGEYEASSDYGDRETLVADSRYAFIESLTARCLTRGRRHGEMTVSDRIDRVATHKYLAVPVFLAAMLIIFAIVFGPAGAFLSDSVGFFVDEYISAWAEGGLLSVGAAPWLVSLVVDGIIAGVGGVLTFLPQIALLFFFLSLLEDSGYMARAAFIMDRMMRRFGLSGKAFIPMLMGFGCTVPAIMGARMMESDRDRRMTIMLVPFMSCSAKLPIYGLIASAFFGARAGLVVFSLYVFGLFMAIASGLIFKKTLFKGDDAAFVMELPPYRLPAAKNTLRHVWDKVRGFLVRAGTLILVMSVVLWFLQSFGMGLIMVSDEAESILGAFGTLIAPIFAPLGFGTWQAAVSLLTGLIAKEAVVASLSMFYGFSPAADSAAIAGVLSGTFATPAAAYAFLVFILLYVPCVAAISTVRKEMQSVKWTLISVGWQLFAAYAASFLVFSAWNIFFR